ncbi:MAG: fumarylacetoacetate hydrolase family protein [Planctomycetes bacterium]|nr:fumarylacetoacetate hydrolase family protein [Planctomycetota bacterium]
MLILALAPDGAARWLYRNADGVPQDLAAYGLTDLASAAAWLHTGADLSQATPLPQAAAWPLQLPGKPGKALALGRNFAAHAKEMGAPPSQEMVWFCKLPDILVGHQQNFEIPTWLPGRVDPEAELVLLLCAPLRDATLEQAAAAIAGYSLGNDLTARGVQSEDKKKSWPWLRSKNVATFGSIGPGWLPTSALRDFELYHLHGVVNGEVRQQASLADMLWPPAQALVELSKWLPLYPGDVVFLGTPAGVGAVEPGDVLEVKLSSADGKDLLHLSNDVVSA